MNGSLFTGLKTALILFAASITLHAGDADTELACYKFGDSRKPQAAVEASARGASAEKLKQIETRLIAILGSAEATADCKGWICGLLRQIGTEASIVPLAALLADKDVSVRACNALQSLPGPKADEALREALPKLPAELQSTVIQTIGARRDAKAVPLLAPLTTHADANVATEALFALGHIDTPDALAALKDAKVPEAHRLHRFQSLLLCADGLVASDNKADAATAYELVFNEGGQLAVRTAGLRGLAQTDKAKASSALIDALKGDDAGLRTAALQCLCESGDDELLTKALENRQALAPAQQAVLLGSASSKAFLPVALEALKSDDAALRVAAVRAIARVGTAAEIPALIENSVKNADDAKEVQAALVRLKDPKVDGELVKLLAADPMQARMAVAALNARGSRGAFAELMKQAATCTDEGVARELGSALTSLATKDDLADLVKLLTTGSNAAVRNAAATAFAGVSKSSGTQKDACSLLAKELPSASTDAKASALSVLSVIGTPDALALAREQLKTAKEPAVKTAAVRCLADWPDATPLDDLLTVAKESSELQQNVLALRGVLNMLAKPGNRPRAEVVERLKQALAAAKRDEEKRQIEGALARWNSVNLALTGKASSPDNLDKDGASGGDQAAIDGKLDTYWDEVDGKKQYILQVDFPEAVDVVGLRITGFQHHSFAPRDFQVFCDKKSVKKVRKAVYTENVLSVELPTTSCKTVQLKITGYYGGSPGIRELEILGPSK